MGLNAIGAHNFFFRLSSADLTSGNYRDSLALRDATNLISKAAQLVADLESIRTNAAKSQSQTFTARIETLVKTLEIDAADYDNGFTLPDLLRAQGVDLTA